MDISYIIGILVLIAEIYAVVMVLQSGEEVLKKILWVVLILVVPLIGLIAWYFAGPGKKPF